MEVPVSPYVFFVPVVILLLYVFNCIKILREYERGVIFRFGHLLQDAKGPGIHRGIPPPDNGADDCNRRLSRSRRRTSSPATT